MARCSSPKAGVEGLEPRIFAVKPDLTMTTVYPTAQRIPFSPFQPRLSNLRPPSVAWWSTIHKSTSAIATRDDRGIITQFGYDGSHRVIPGRAFPAQGDYGVHRFARRQWPPLFRRRPPPPTAASSDSITCAGLRKHRDFCDQSYQDLELLGPAIQHQEPPLPACLAATNP